MWFFLLLLIFISKDIFNVGKRLILVHSLSVFDHWVFNTTVKVLDIAILFGKSVSKRVERFRFFSLFCLFMDWLQDLWLYNSFGRRNFKLWLWKYGTNMSIEICLACLRLELQPLQESVSILKRVKRNDLHS